MKARSHTLSASWYFPSPLFRPLQLSLTSSTCLLPMQSLFLVLLSYYLLCYLSIADKPTLQESSDHEAPFLIWEEEATVHVFQGPLDLATSMQLNARSVCCLSHLSHCLEHAHDDFMAYACTASQPVNLPFQTVSSASSSQSVQCPSNLP